MLRSAALDKASQMDEEVDLANPPKWTEADDLYKQDWAYQYTIEKLDSSAAENDILLDKFLKQEKDLKAAYALVQEAAQQTRLQNVPLAITLNYMMWALATEDKIKVQQEYQAEPFSNTSRGYDCRRCRHKIC